MGISDYVDYRDMIGKESAHTQELGYYQQLRAHSKYGIPFIIAFKNIYHPFLNLKSFQNNLKTGS